ncbi:MAG: valine--tRNA ligase [Candidatus Yanofskybacteria bacterium]|nr:valine--tRNA ligase [Candidatus Yanofskybacteria bacterium]
MELPKHYNPEESEEKYYKLWEKSGFFNPDVCKEKGAADPSKEVFSLVLPPPNVTGTLHMGHAAMLAIEDIIVRYARMQGRPTLWIPGTDHAAIATQSKVERQLYEQEQKTRHDLGREEFLKRVREFAQGSHDTIIHQIKKMGASLDWSRQAYTLDEQRSSATYAAFKRMYELGLIYRGNRIVNWCPRCSSTLADDEVEYKETNAVLYTFRYAKDVPIAISTTRPETKFGDTALAVHPEDKRYREYSGKVYTINLGAGDQEIRVIADESVDSEFGTGALGVTPAHSQIDAEIAQRHNLPSLQVINEKGEMTERTGPYAGLPVKEARKRFVAWLKEQGLLEREQQIPQNISVCYRCGTPIEPLPSLQWFIAVNKEFVLKHSQITGIASGSQTTLKELMRKVVAQKQITILPEQFEKTYFHWIDNLRDWCISRQIWFGHQIPVWYKNGEIFVGEKAPSPEWRRDPDTLDTWFSSGLWTFSTLGWPKDTDDLKTYHPTTLLETGYDILFFWVARMILLSGCLLGDIPFKTVYLHGLVRDEKGKKMSKSLGNVIDPLDMISKYGADATRLSLIVGVAPGSDSKLSENKVRGYKYFTNKLWNISRFVLMQTEDYDPKATPQLSREDEKILQEFRAMAQEVTRHIEGYRFYLAADSLYQYLWHTFADKVLEDSKPLLKDSATRAARQYVLVSILADSVKLLHPFTPFVTEAIYQNLPLAEKKETIMIEPWPVSI